MHKPFYASGFLFHLESQQILLHHPQQNDTTAVWSMFGRASDKEENAQDTFRQIILDLLHITLPRKNIFPVYDYFHNARKTMHYVCYAQVPKPRSFKSSNIALSWFTFKQTTKLACTEETKRDIIVAQRVIDAADRVTTKTQYYPPDVPFNL